MWKKNLLEDLETGEVEFGSAREILLELRKKFRRGDEESIKVTELRRIEQGGRIMEELVQEFQRAAKSNRYKERELVEKFKREMNGAIMKKLMEAEKSPTSIK